MELDFYDMNSEFYGKFTTYLSYNLKMQRNTVGNIIKTLKTFMHWALDDGCNNPTKFIKAFKVWKESTNQIVLNDDEIIKIESIYLSNNDKLIKARDVFLICLFTGLRYGDYLKLLPAHINLIKKEMRLITTKTKDAVGINIESNRT